MIGRTRALTAAGAVAILAAGIGIGAALTGGGKSSPPTTAAAATATATSSPSAADFTLTGTMTLKLGAFEWLSKDGGDPCTGYDGYTDITAGAPVVVTDQTGTVIATGQLATGTATVDTTTGHATACTFTLSVPHVPDRPFYGVTVTHRGAVTYSAGQARGGQVALTLG